MAVDATLVSQGIVAPVPSLQTVHHTRCPSLVRAFQIAALVVMAAGFIAGIGAYHLASGVIAITSFLLVEKRDGKRHIAGNRCYLGLVRE